MAEWLFAVGEYLLNVRLWAVLRLLEDRASAEEVDKMLFGSLRITNFTFLSLQVRHFPLPWLTLCGWCG